MPGHDLTDASYWGQRQTEAVFVRQKLLDARQAEWFQICRPHLEKYSGRRFLELGCSPGLASALICGHIRFQAEGVDISPAAEQYLANLAAVGAVNAKLHQIDVRKFYPQELFDVVASFGLVEHFADPLPMLLEHQRLLRQGGLCVIVVPNFRGLQHLYHWLFDGPDLRRHNVEMMHLPLFRKFAEQVSHEVLYLGYAGKMRFWNADASGPALFRQLRLKTASFVRLASKPISVLLPGQLSWCAPWIVYVAIKR